MTADRAPWRVLAGLLLTAVMLTQPGSVRGAAAQAAGDPAAELAQRYRPIVAVRTQDTECGSGEPYRPTTVESVLGRDGVVLRDANGAVITDRPTAADLFRGPDGEYLDLPGNPLDPGCSYERWWRSFQADLPTATYARVATDPERPGKLVVQYWFWWVFNDWNDKHEGDWETFHVVFDADSVEEALGEAPVEVVYAQHEGAQYRAWGDPALERDGDRALYYPGAGSHAGYDSPNRWFGKSSSAGFGCDDTRAPVTRLDPEVVLVPAQAGDITSADDPFAWLTFSGRWGEKERAFNNGPQGPPLKESWTNPVRWVEDFGRPNAVSLPPLGSRATDAFCSLSASGSLLFIGFLDQPLLVATLLVGLLALVVLALTRTRWRPSEPQPVAQVRRAGRIFTASSRLQWHHRRTYAGLGLVVLGGGIMAAILSAVLLRLTSLGDLADVAGGGGGASSGWAVPVALLAGALVHVPVVAAVLGASAAVVDAEADPGGTVPDTKAALLRGVRPAGGFVAAVLLILLYGVALAVPPLAVVGLVLLARLPATTPSGVRERLGTRASFRRSWMLARGHGWHTFGVGLVAVIALFVVGPLAGALLLVVTGWSFALVNLAAAVVGMVTVTWAGTVMALLREDLVARKAPAAEAVLADA